MFFLELAVGVFAESTALIADAFDKLTNATVHGISLYAVGRARKWLSRRFELAPCMMP